MRISDWSSDVCSSDLLVVDHREGRHRPGAHAEVGHQAVGAAEGEAAGAEALAQSLQIDRTVLQAGDQPHLALLVAQAEVLDVVAGQLAAQRLGLLHREAWRVAARKSVVQGKSVSVR